MRNSAIVLVIVVCTLAGALICAAGDSESLKKMNILSSKVRGNFLVAVGHGLIGGRRYPLVLRRELPDGLLWCYVYDIQYPGTLLSSELLENGDIVAVGYAYNPSTRSHDTIVIRVDKMGGVVWAYSIGGEGFDAGKDIAVLDSGDIVVVGYTYSFSKLGDSDILVLKISGEGKLLESVVMGEEAYDDVAKKVTKTRDRNLLVLGETWSHKVSGSDVLIVKINPYIKPSLSISVGGASLEEATAGIDTGDGYLIGGVTRSFLFGLNDGFVFRLDPHGNLIYVRGVGWTGNDGITGIYATEDGFLLLGYASFREERGDVILVDMTASGMVRAGYIIARDGFDIPQALNNINEFLYLSAKMVDGNAELVLFKIAADWTSGSSEMLSTSGVNMTSFKLLRITDPLKYFTWGEWKVRRLKLFRREADVAVNRLTAARHPVGVYSYNAELIFGEYSEKKDWLGELLDLLERHVMIVIAVLPFVVLSLVWTLLRLYRFLQGHIKR